jgi:phosphoglycerol transferase
VAAALARRRWLPLISAGLLVSAISVGVVANIAPSFLYCWQHGPNPEAVERVTLDAELQGLKLTYLLLPVEGHRLGFLAKIRDRYDLQCRQLNLPTVSQRAGLGLLGAVGFIFLIGRAVLARDRRKPTLPGGLATLTLAAVLLGALGGFGVFVAMAGAKWIRGYERISVVIAFLALAALAWLLDWARQRWVTNAWQRWLFRGGLTALLLLGVLDQTKAGCWFRPYDTTREEFASDAAFVTQIEAAVPPRSMIFQLPFVPYPEVRAPHHMGTYDHARGYLHSRTLRWSYGAMKGRPTSRWQQDLAALPPEEMIRELENAGFQGIYVDRNGYADNAAALEAELTRLLGGPAVESPNNRLVYYDLRLGRSRPRGT